jgi:hypothetical protein
MANLTLTKMVFPTVANNFQSGGSNALTPDPKEVAVATSSSAIDIDLAAPMSIDTFFMGFLTATTLTGVTVQTATGLGTGLGSAVALNLGPTTALRRHAYLDKASPDSSRYFRVNFTYTGTLSVGIMGFGLAVQPTYGHEWGSGRQPIDTAAVTALRGGGFARELGAVKGAWQFTTGELTDTDLDSLWDLSLDVGIGSPVLVMEDPALTGAAMNRALHYGLLQRPDVYQRLTPGQSSWSWRVEEWV